MKNRGRYCGSNNQEDVVMPCDPGDNFKSNCDPDFSEEIEVHCTDICNAKCVGILAEKIFDCVYSDNLQFADKDEVFTIDNFDPSMRDQYRTGDPIRIDDISLCYDFIGTKDDDDTDGTNIGPGNILVRYDMENTVFSAVPGNAHKACNYPDSVTNSKDPVQPTVNLYTEFEGAVSNNKCNPESGYPTRKARVFKQGVRFYAGNLKIRIRGRIGSRPFTATKDYGCFGNETNFAVNPVEITKKDTLDNGHGCGEDTGLNFVPVNLYGRVSVPNDGRAVKSNISYETCLSADCIETTERYGDEGPGQIIATVGYSFLVTSNIRHTTSEELGVFTNPERVKCRSTNRESDCVDNENSSDPLEQYGCRRKCECKKYSEYKR